MANLNRKNFGRAKAEKEHTSKLFYELFSTAMEYQENEKRFRDYKGYESQLIERARRLEKGESNYQERIDVAYKIRELELALGLIYDRFMLASVKLAKWLDKVEPGKNHFTFLDLGWEKALTTLEPDGIFFLQSSRMLKRNQKSIVLVKPGQQIRNDAVFIEDLRD